MERLSLNDIRNTPWNGYNILSVYSGIGGSLLGYRQAGFDIKGAIENDPETIEILRKNFNRLPLIPSDITTLSGQDILNALGLQKESIHVLDGSPVCLLAGQSIITSTGYKKIEDIQVGDLVYTHKGRYRKVLNTMKTPYSGDIYSVFVERLDKPLQVTEEHPLLLIDSTSDFWCSANHLRRNDHIAFNPYSETVVDFSNILYAELFGFYALFGYIDSKRGKVLFNIKNDHLSYQAVLNAVIEANLSSETFTLNGFNYIAVQDAELFNLCKLFGARGERQIPEPLIQSSNAYLQKFLRSLVLSNRNPNPEKFFKASNSLELLLGYQRMLLRFGCISSIRECVGRSTEFRYNALYINDIGFSRLKHLLDCDIETASIHNYRYTRIRDIDIAPYEGFVYNLEVEEDNSYCCHTFTVHNCNLTTPHTTKQEKQLLSHFTAITEAINPPIVVSLFPDGSKDRSKAPMLNEFVSDISNLNYAVSVKGIDFSFMGVPQELLGVLFIGIRKDLKLLANLPIDLKNPSKPKDFLEDLIDSLPDTPITNEEQYFMRLIPVGSDTGYLDMLKTKYKLSIPYNYRRDTWEEPFPNLDAYDKFIHPLKNRWLTLLETQRLHTFPDEFTWDYPNEVILSRLKDSTPPLGMFYIAQYLKSKILSKFKNK